MITGKRFKNEAKTTLMVKRPKGPSGHESDQLIHLGRLSKRQFEVLGVRYSKLSQVNGHRLQSRIQRRVIVGVLMLPQILPAYKPGII